MVVCQARDSHPLAAVWKCKQTNVEMLREEQKVDLRWYFSRPEPVLSFKPLPRTQWQLTTCSPGFFHLRFLYPMNFICSSFQILHQIFKRFSICLISIKAPVFSIHNLCISLFLAVTLTPASYYQSMPLYLKCHLVLQHHRSMIL